MDGTVPQDDSLKFGRTTRAAATCGRGRHCDSEWRDGSLGRHIIKPGGRHLTAGKFELPDSGPVRVRPWWRRPVQPDPPPTRPPKLDLDIRSRRPRRDQSLEPRPEASLAEALPRSSEQASCGIPHHIIMPSEQEYQIAPIVQESVVHNTRVRGPPPNGVAPRPADHSPA